jgi:hypothetical protein
VVTVGIGKFEIANSDIRCEVLDIIFCDAETQPGSWPPHS